MPFLIFLIPVSMLLHAMANQPEPVALWMWILPCWMFLAIIATAILHERMKLNKRLYGDD